MSILKFVDTLVCNPDTSETIYKYADIFKCRGYRLGIIYDEKEQTNKVYNYSTDMIAIILGELQDTETNDFNRFDPELVMKLLSFYSYRYVRTTYNTRILWVPQCEIFSNREQTTECINLLTNASRLYIIPSTSVYPISGHNIRRTVAYYDSVNEVVLNINKTHIALLLSTVDTRTNGLDVSTVFNLEKIMKLLTKDTSAIDTSNERVEWVPVKTSFVVFRGVCGKDHYIIDPQRRPNSPRCL